RMDEIAGKIMPAIPLLVAQVYSRRLASAVKLALGECYPDEWPVKLVRVADVDTNGVGEMVVGMVGQGGNRQGEGEQDVDKWGEGEQDGDRQGEGEQDVDKWGEGEQEGDSHGDGAQDGA